MNGAIGIKLKIDLLKKKNHGNVLLSKIQQSLSQPHRCGQEVQD